MTVESRAEARARLVLAAAHCERALSALREASEQLRHVTDSGTGMDGMRRTLYGLRSRIDETTAELRDPRTVETVDFDGKGAAHG